MNMVCKSGKPGRFRVACAAVVLLFALLAIWLWPATLDDAFISYRYARNAVEGHGLVFSPGERVEGYSNLLWILLLCPAVAVGINVEWVAKVLGIACGSGAILLLMLLLRRHFRVSRPFVLLGGLWLATCTGFVYYAISGLETLFYAVQLLILIWLLLRKRFDWAALLCSTLLITRPEGMLYIPVLGLAVWMERSGRGGRLFLRMAENARVKPSGLWWIHPLIPVLVLALVTLWRWSYYGALLPNTFNAKIKTHWGVIQFIFWHSQTFINYAYKSLAWNEWILFVACFYLIFRLRRRDMAPAAVLGALLFFIWFSGSDWMSFGRFYVPVLPVIGLFGWAGMQHLMRTLPRFRICSRRLWLWLSLPIFCNLVTLYYAAEELNFGQTINPAMHSRPHRAIGLWLKNHARKGDKLVVNEIGAIGWYSELPIIDMIGLTDKAIPGFWKSGDFDACADFILAQNPRYIGLNDRQSAGDEGMDPAHHALFERMERTGNYRLVHTFPLQKGKNLLLFERSSP